MKVHMTQKQITGLQKSNVWAFYVFFPSRMNFLSKKYYYLPAVQSIVITFLFSFFGEVDGGPCVLHKHKIIEILAFHSAKWGAGRVVMAGLAQTGCLICSWHPVLRNTSCRDGRKKRHSWSHWLSRKLQCNVEVCGIWAAAARRELWGANAPGLYRILFTNLPPDPPQTPPFSRQVKNDLLRH